MLSPNILQVVLLHREPLVVLKGAYLADEDAVIHYVVRGFVLHTVYAKFIEFVVNNLLGKVGHQVRVLLLWNVLWYG